MVPSEPLRSYVIFRDPLGWYVKRCPDLETASKLQLSLEKRDFYAFAVQAHDDERLVAGYWQAAEASWWTDAS
jgi:hypothetical protein